MNEMRQIKTCVLALAASLAACQGTNEPQIGPTTSVTINTCSAGALGWFAYQNTGGAWTKITPTVTGQLIFEATEKVSLAVAIDFFGSSLTQVINATSAELNQNADAGCDLIAIGGATMSGTVVGLTGDQAARISAAASETGADALDPSWTLEDLPTTKVDVVATRYPTLFTSPSDRVLVRRGVTPTGASIAALDFNSSEAAAPQSATVTFTGSGANGSIEAASMLLTETGTLHTLGSLFSASGSTSFNYLSLPASLRIATDMHQLLGLSLTAQGFKQVSRFYKTPSDVTLGFGPMVSMPAFTSLGTSPYLRVRADVASQAEYPGLVQVDYSQPVNDETVKLFSIVTTAGFYGSTPTTWDLSIPDLSSAGYNSAWGLQSGTYYWSVTASSGNFASVVGATPAEGTTIVSATRVDPNGSALSTTRLGALQRRPALLLRARRAE
jgi:hypothetical protein